MTGSDKRQFDDPRWCEAQYNNRQLVKNAQDFVDRWPKQAAETRSRLRHDADVPYGPHARETMDIFRADNARGLLVFVHGGYWRTLSKAEFSWVAERFVEAGYTVALVNYPLCPEVTIRDIATSTEKAVTKIWSLASARERESFVVAGHSAGGYLVAHLFTVDWTRYGMPSTPFAGGISISGLFELAPLVNASMNEQLRLTPETAAAWSLDRVEPRVQARLILAPGAEESSEFVRQSVDQAKRWPGVSGPADIIEGRNHFDIVDDLTDPSSRLFGLTMRLLDGA
ncbi:MAG TPA: alpha/beta hydrolase [Hyphomicrobiaceae bacterium]|nr:alpha/beta hydrolase [Hyphomicrobiaceae bacterium]